MKAIFASTSFPALVDLNTPPALGAKGLRTICKSTPPFRLRRLRIYIEEKDNLKAFTEWPGLESVREFDLHNSLIRDRAGILFRAPRLAELRVLRIEMMGNKPAEVSAFDALAADTSLLPKLTHLHLQWARNVIPDATLDELRARFGDGFTSN